MEDVGHLFVRVAGEEGDIGTVRQLLEQGTISLHSRSEFCMEAAHH
jgi:hypothetical protein